ncbi:MAG: hypothetical protein HY042_05580 [Spirochaetia bacterium]|nr:hypothetical protein [Spirochaetia bacterium]
MNYEAPTTDSLSRAVLRTGYRRSAANTTTERGLSFSQEHVSQKRQAPAGRRAFRFTLGLTSGSQCDLTLLPVEGGYRARISVEDPVLERALFARLRFLETALSSSIVELEVGKASFAEALT